MHGDVLSTRSVNGATIVHVESVDGVPMSGRIVSNSRSLSSKFGDKRERNDGMMDIGDVADDEDEEDKERKAKRRVGEIATGMAKMRLMLTKGDKSFGFTEGRRNNKLHGIHGIIKRNKPLGVAKMQ